MAANQKHLAILRQGVEVWNQWRKNPRVRPNLSGANLSEANLSGVNLSRALQLHLFGESLPEGAFGEKLFSL